MVKYFRRDEICYSTEICLAQHLMDACEVLQKCTVNKIIRQYQTSLWCNGDSCPITHDYIDYYEFILYIYRWWIRWIRTSQLFAILYIVTRLIISINSECFYSRISYHQWMNEPKFFLLCLLFFNSCVFPNLREILCQCWKKVDVIFNLENR